MRYGWHAGHSWPDVSDTPIAPVVCLHVCVCVFLVQSSTVKRSRGLDSADQTLSPGDKDPPVLVCSMSTLISHAASSVLTLSLPVITCSSCTCRHQSPHFTSPLQPFITPCFYMDPNSPLIIGVIARSE